MAKDITEINDKILKLKQKRKDILDKRYQSIGKCLVKEYDLSDCSTEEILELIRGKSL